MSIWHQVKEIDDIEVSEDKKTLDILFRGDNNGNEYIEIPLEFIRQKTYESDVKFLVEFLEWMNKINSETPMQLETDDDDIAMMFLEERGNK